MMRGTPGKTITETRLSILAVSAPSSTWGFSMASRNRWYDYAVAFWLGFVLLMVAVLVAAVVL